MESSCKANHDPLQSEKVLLKPPILRQHLKTSAPMTYCALMTISILSSWLLSKPPTLSSVVLLPLVLLLFLKLKPKLKLKLKLKAGTGVLTAATINARAKL